MTKKIFDTGRWTTSLSPKMTKHVIFPTPTTPLDKTLDKTTEDRKTVPLFDRSVFRLRIRKGIDNMAQPYGWKGELIFEEKNKDGLIVSSSDFRKSLPQDKPYVVMGPRAFSEFEIVRWAFDEVAFQGKTVEAVKGFGMMQSAPDETPYYVYNLHMDGDGVGFMYRRKDGQFVWRINSARVSTQD